MSSVFSASNHINFQVKSTIFRLQPSVKSSDPPPKNGLPNRSRSLPKNHSSILPLLKMFPNEIWDHPQDHQAFTGSTACGNIPKGAKVFPSKTTFLEARSVAAWQQTRQRQLMMVSHKVINNRCTPIFDQNGATTN